MGISDIRRVTTKLTSRPVVVLNSHTHDDHVGGNWQFAFVYGMDTDFTRKNAKGSREDAQAEIAPRSALRRLAEGIQSKKHMPRDPGESRTSSTTASKSISAAARSKFYPRPAIRRMPSVSSTAPTACSLQVTPTIPRPSGCSGRKQISTLT